MQPNSSGAMPQDQFGDPFAQMRFVFAFFEIILRFMSLPLEVVLHRQFGERYFSGTSIVMWVVIVGSILSANQTGGPGRINLLLVSPGLIGFMIVYLIMGVWHLGGIYNRAIHAVQLYSYYDGIPAPCLFWFEPSLPAGLNWEDLVKRYAEPMLVFLISFPLQLIDPLFGAFLCVSSVALYMRNTITFRRMRTLFLDARDAMLLGQVMQKALSGDTAARDNYGFAIPGRKSGNDLARAAASVAYGQLDPLFKGMLKRPDQGSPETPAPQNGHAKPSEDKVGSVQAKCAHCNVRLKVLDELVGKKVKCPMCKEDFVVSRVG